MDKKIMVVDDEALSVLMLRRFLERQLSCQILTALDGNEALLKADLDPPDVVLLDIRMPGMDGFEVCQRLKSNPKTTGARIIYVSAYRVPDEPLECGDGYVAKPIDTTLLLGIVKELLCSPDE